jgi:hypothetical protein
MLIKKKKMEKTIKLNQKETVSEKMLREMNEFGSTGLPSEIRIQKELLKQIIKLEKQHL